MRTTQQKIPRVATFGRSAAHDDAWQHMSTRCGHLAARTGQRENGTAQCLLLQPRSLRGAAPMAVLSRHVAGASASRITHMAAWWNTWTHLQDVRFDYETEPKPRPVRLSGPSIVIGQPVRIGVSGVEVEAVIAAVDRGVLTAALKRLTLIRAATPPAAASSRSRGLLLGRPARARHLETCRFFQRRTDHLVRTRRAGYVGRN